MFFVILQAENGNHSIAGRKAGGKSGQLEPPYFLTGRGAARKRSVTESATETKPPGLTVW